MNSPEFEPEAWKTSMETQGDARDAALSHREAAAFNDHSYLSALGALEQASIRYNKAFLAWYDPEAATETKRGKGGRPRKGEGASTLLAPLNLAAYAAGTTFNGHQDLHRSLMLKDKEGIWATDDNIGARYSDTKSGVIRYQPAEVAAWWEEQRANALSALDERFKQIKEGATADTIDILFHHWYHWPHPKENDAAAITLAQICGYRGVKPTGDNLKNAWQAMRDITAIRLSFGGFEGSLFFIESAPGPQLNLFGNDAHPEANRIFIYSPGRFLAKAIQQNPGFVSAYLQQLWKLDPYRHVIAKKLGHYLRHDWRMNPEKYSAQTRYRAWSALLDEAGIDVEPYRKPDCRNPSRLITDVNRALSKLYEIECIASPGPQDRPRAEQPDTAMYEDRERYFATTETRRGRLDAWLALRVCIAPHTDWIEAQREYTERRREWAEKAKALPPGRKRKAEN
jgi:hypothetical protein